MNPILHSCLLQNRIDKKMDSKKLNNGSVCMALNQADGVVFNFSGGLADQVRYLAYAIDFCKSGRAQGKKIYFNSGAAEQKWGGYKLDKFNISSVINFEIINSDSCAKHVIEKMSGQMSDSMPYAADIRNAMKLMIPLDKANTKMIEKIRAVNSVCVHIRRTDFIGRIKKNGSMGAVSAKYINNSISKIISSVPDAHFFIFSQDFDWVKQNINFADAKYEFVNINDSLHGEFELELMKNCQNFILSCGGFGRLAAFLSEYKNKMIISPNLRRIRDWEIFEYDPFLSENMHASFYENMRMFRKKIYAYFLIFLWKIGIKIPA